MNRRPPQNRERETSRRANPPVVKSARRRRGGEWRDRNRRKPDLLGIVRSLFVLLLIGQCLRVAFVSPRLQLARIEVAGTERFSAEQLARIGQVPMGSNIFRVNLTRVSTALKTEPLIREAVVARQLPNTLQVTLRERTPALQVVRPDRPGKAYLADAEGILFQEVAPRKQGQADSDLPLVEMPAKQVPVLGKSLQPQLTEAVLECARLAVDQEVDVAKMRVDGAGELWLNVVIPAASRSQPDVLDVRLGRWTELPEKFRDIRKSLQGWPQLTETASHLDVMCAGRPAYKRLAEQSTPQNREP